MFYKFKEIGGHWFIMFSKDGKNTFIHDDVEALRTFMSDNKEEIFVSGDNYFFDNEKLLLY